MKTENWSWQRHLGDRIIQFPQGRILGGTSALNAQAFIAPSEVGIALWRELGNPGWDWKSMLPYFKKCCTLPTQDVESADLPTEFQGDEKYRDGRESVKLSLSQSFEDTLGKAWIDTFRALGYDLGGDPFSENGTGGFQCLATVDASTKVRSYSASAYYRPLQNRTNLVVLTGYQVERIIFNADVNLARASGVIATKDNTTQSFTASKEVILAAGTFNSPKLLELSGIGSSERLNANGIETVVDNPNVGENLQDHPMSGISFEVRDDVFTLDALRRRDPKAITEAMRAYQNDLSGPLSSSGITSFAFMPIAEFQPPGGQAATKEITDAYPPTENDSNLNKENDFIRSVIFSRDKSSATYFMTQAQGNFGGEVGVEGESNGTRKPANFITVAALLSYPLSRGTVHIRSSSASDKPIIDPRYLTHPLDLEIFARHVRWIETLVGTEPLASFIKPGGRRQPRLVDVGPDLSAAKNFLRYTVRSGWHPVGTCVMLPRARGGVVDERLIVYGTSNLRVVDASIMPLISRGNLQSLVYVVAEKAADMIKNDHGIM